MSFSHVPVLLDESIKLLSVCPDGIFVDGTAGGGGHSEAIAKMLDGGRLIALDIDPDAVAAASERLKKYKNVTVVRANFTQIGNVLDDMGIDAVNGVLLDLGVSSYQLDTPERGFSYHHDAPLDMRMAKSGKSAFDIVNNSDFEELKNIIFKYGEERYAKRIARAVEMERKKSPIYTTGQLAQIIANALPFSARRDRHPARKTFQAIRIAVNNELFNLELGIRLAFDRLLPGGRMVLITFHSLEDRIVKQSFAGFCKGCSCPPDFPQCVCGKTPTARLLTKKPISPSRSEQQNNPRSRSAKLRAIQKI